MPRVSVLTPIYNTNPQYLREMIESILNQTFTDFEFLILNDSPQNTEIESIVKQYAKSDKRIKYFKNEKNMGITPSRNKLLDLSTGEYLAIFDHDDISVPDRLEKQVAFLDANPYVGVVSGWLKYFGAENVILQSPEKDCDIKKCLTGRCCVFHTAAMIRKSVLIDNDIRYEEFYTPAEDYRLWARLMEVTNFYNIQQVLVRYRCFSGNTSIKMQSQMVCMGEYVRNQIADVHPFLRQEYVKGVHKGTVYRLRLFGIIPILKIKNNWWCLFEFIPVFKQRWK
jgi:glycosyltransferase involved in cell wall biosynthesis